MLGVFVITLAITVPSFVVGARQTRADAFTHPTPWWNAYNAEGVHRRPLFNPYDVFDFNVANNLFAILRNFYDSNGAFLGPATAADFSYLVTGDETDPGGKFIRLFPGENDNAFTGNAGNENWWQLVYYV